MTGGMVEPVPCVVSVATTGAVAAVGLDSATDEDGQRNLSVLTMEGTAGVVGVQVSWVCRRRGCCRWDNAYTAAGRIVGLWPDGYMLSLLPLPLLLLLISCCWFSLADRYDRSKHLMPRSICMKAGSTPFIVKNLLCGLNG
jgi:hypothetical protein